jgi:hypothetical protein
MTSKIVRGMPFVTMEYDKEKISGSSPLPTMASTLEIQDPILIDGSDTKLVCPLSMNLPMIVQRRIFLS